MFIFLISERITTRILEDEKKELVEKVKEKDERNSYLEGRNLQLESNFAYFNACVEESAQA